MEITEDDLVGTFARGRDTVDIPIVEHPEAEERYIVSETKTPLDGMKSYKLLGIEVDVDTLSTVDYNPDDIGEEDVVVYHVLAAHQREDGNICSHNIIEIEADCLDGFVATVNEERLPLNQTLRVGDLDGHVGHVLNAIASEISTHYLDDYVQPEDLPDSVEFRLKSHSTYSPEVEIISLGRLARDHFDRDFPDFDDFEDVYSRSELNADEYERLRNRVREQAVTEEDRRCAELSECELETKQVRICVPSEFFDRKFESFLEHERSFQAVNPLSEAELREKAKKRALEYTPAEDTYEVLCGVNWNGQ